MTVPTQTNKAIFTANGVTTEFPFTFGTLPTADLVVTLIYGETETVVSPSDYTVRGAGRDDGGSVVFNDPPASGLTVLIQRLVPYTQPTDYKNQGSFYPRTHERSFDRATMQVQQLAEEVSRSLRIRPDYTLPVSVYFPTPEASRLIGWNADGSALRNTDPSGPGDLLLRSDLADPTGGAGLVAMPAGGTVIDAVQYVTPEQFNAKGDGVADDTAALNAAIASLSARRQLVLGPKVYLISATLNQLPVGARVRGEGATIRRESGAGNIYMMVVNQDNVIDGVVFDGNDAAFATSTRGVSFPGNTPTQVTRNIVVSNCKFFHMQNGIRGDGGINWRIYGNHFENTRNAQVLFGTHDGYDCSHNIIANNTFLNSGDTAVAFFSTSANAEMSYNIIANNVAKNTQQRTGGYAFDFEGGVGEDKHHNAIIGNLVEHEIYTGFDQGGCVMAGCEHGVVANNTVKGAGPVAGSIGTGISVRGSKNITVIGNSVDNFDLGISTEECDGVVVSGNNVVDCGRDSQVYSGISICRLSFAKNVLVEGNIVSFTHADNGAAGGITCYSPSGATIPISNITIRGNKIVNKPGRGVYAYGISGVPIDGIDVRDNSFTDSGAAVDAIDVRYAKNVAVRGNLMRDVVRGFIVRNSDRVSFVGNTVSDDRAVPLLTRYFSVGDIANISTNVVIEGNTFYGVATGTGIPGAAEMTAAGRFLRNFGPTGEASGETGPVSTGASISHGCAYAPKSISITPKGSFAPDAYVGVVTNSVFSVHFTGGGAKEFYWNAKA